MFVIVLGCLLFAGPFWPSSETIIPNNSQGTEIILNIKIDDYSLHSKNFLDALTKVATQFKLPMGVEWVLRPTALYKVSLSWRDVTVQEVLQGIVKTQPDYKMLIVDGIVRISPGLVRDGENPLKVNIGAFEVHNIPVEMASRALHEAVRRTAVPPKPQEGIRGGIAGSGFSNIDDPKISVTLKNATIENVLDALALNSARKVWIVTFTDDPTLTTTGFRRTLTLWNEFPIPDTEQPVWDLLHWGDALPTAVLAK